MLNQDDGMSVTRNQSHPSHDNIILKFHHHVHNHLSQQTLDEDMLKTTLQLSYRGEMYRFPSQEYANDSSKLYHETDPFEVTWSRLFPSMVWNFSSSPINNTFTRYGLMMNPEKLWYWVGHVLSTNWFLWFLQTMSQYRLPHYKCCFVVKRGGGCSRLQFSDRIIPHLSCPIFPCVSKFQLHRQVPILWTKLLH